MKIFLITLIACSHNFSFAQGFSNVSRLEKYLDLLPLNEVKNSVEIRLYTRTKHRWILTVLSKDSSGWKAVQKTKRYQMIHSLVPGVLDPKVELYTHKLEATNADEIIKVLKRNNVVTLKSDSNIHFNRDIKEKYLGVGYMVSCKIGNNTNTFQFSNPDLYLKYNPKVEELRQYQNIVNVFNSLNPEQESN